MARDRQRSRVSASTTKARAAKRCTSSTRRTVARTRVHYTPAELPRAATSGSFRSSSATVLYSDRDRQKSFTRGGEIMRTALFLGIVVGAVGVATTALSQQPVGQTKALSHAIHAVNDLDTTLAFYRDVFGIDGKAVEFANPAVPLLTNAPGVTLRLSMVALPGGTRFEFTHFKGLERQPAQAKYWDPGAASLVLYVRDLDALVAAAKKAKATIVTTGGAPVEISTAKGKARSIVLRDPDGFFLQLVQEAPATGAPDSTIQRVALAFTMEDVAATKRFYTGMLGVELNGAGAF